ncbi:PLP-dependent aminotransferase family protein [Phytoactinopolyspora alkaliphila]|uniref:PLP-dependent aminotransferase family protein n=1 Tax=Phytoactinopolyspora alkaliphila TaxID=1783498 RepID=A0A6N9YJT1_9ACTN|nr:PLP-dependent aminotransferase family protein [Phytoactinopolyspora alkaliphila]NED95253.1 PLP-dependent aminotransferase family protein [Phytoactinopolyspora alkaliphila]
MQSFGGRQLARALGPWSRIEDSGPAYARLAAAIRMLILDGRVPLDARLPGERELAGVLGVSRTTVTAAYDLLRSTGYAASRQGSGTRTTLPATHTSSLAGSFWSPFGPDGSDILDLAHAAPEAPERTLHEAYEVALSQLPRYLPTCGYDLFGLPALRAAIAHRFTVRGLPTIPEQILVTSGAQHAFSLALSVFTDPGDRVLIEHPTYPNAIDAIRRLNARTVPVAFAGNGWDTDAFAAALRQTGPRLAYLVPDFHNPTGLTATAVERDALASSLAENRTVAVVDETLSELALEGDAPAPFATCLPDQLAVTVGSVSKPFWGGLRIGWIRADTTTVRRLASARATSDISSAMLEQLATVELLTRMDDVLPSRREELRNRRDALMSAIDTQLPGWSVRRPRGGLVLWCDLGSPVSSRLVAAAERHGLRLAAGPRFGVDGAFERRLRLPYTLPVQTLEHAVDVLAQAYAAVTDGTAISTANIHDLFA